MIPPTSSAVVARREATIFSSGGDSYSSVNDVRAIVFRTAAENQFLDPRWSAEHDARHSFSKNQGTKGITAVI